MTMTIVPVANDLAHTPLVRDLEEPACDQANRGCKSCYCRDAPEDVHAPAVDCLAHNLAIVGHENDQQQQSGKALDDASPDQCPHWIETTKLRLTARTVIAPVPR